MIDALVSGRLTAKPMKRLDNHNKSFVTARFQAATYQNEMIQVNLIAFDEQVCQTLLTLDEGDTLSVSGSLTPKVWKAKDGLIRPIVDLMAHAVLTPYQINAKRAMIVDDEA